MLPWVMNLMIFPEAIHAALGTECNDIPQDNQCCLIIAALDNEFNDIPPGNAAM